MRPSRGLTGLFPAAALSALLFASGVLLPLVGQPLGFLSAAPLVWLAARHGLRPGLAGALLATALLLPVLPPPVTLIFAIEHALPAAWLGLALARGRGVALPSAAAALAITTVLLGGAYFLAGEAGRDPASILEQQLRAAFAELGGDGADSGEFAAARQQLEGVLALLRRVLPAIALVGIFLECALNTLLVARFLSRRQPGFPAPDLAAFALPEGLVWVLIPVLALSLLPLRPLATVALNALIPLLVAYLLQGLAIALHLADRAGLSRLGRLLITVAFAIQPWLLALPLLLGLLDFRFSFRSRTPPGAT